MLWMSTNIWCWWVSSSSYKYEKYNFWYFLLFLRAMINNLWLWYTHYLIILFPVSKHIIRIIHIIRISSSVSNFIIFHRFCELRQSAKFQVYNKLSRIATLGDTSSDRLIIQLGYHIKKKSLASFYKLELARFSTLLRNGLKKE